MNDAQMKLNDLFGSFKAGSGYKDSLRMEIMLKRSQFENCLDDIWKSYSAGNMLIVVEYKKLVAQIKSAGLIVQRSKSSGKHRIVFK